MSRPRPFTSRPRSKPENYIHCVSKTIPPLTRYNFDIHDPITTIMAEELRRN